MRNAIFAATAALTLSGAAAQAASVTITLTEFDNRASAVSAQSWLLGGYERAYEDFEDFTSADTQICTTRCRPVTSYDYATAADPLSTSVGDFSSILPVGAGGSNRAPDDAAIIRSNANENNNGQPNFGRYDADDNRRAGSNFIDSNDNRGIRLDTSTSGISHFNWISFVLTDLDDVGGVNFAIAASGDALTGPSATNLVKRGNGDVFLATLYFDVLVKDVIVDMTIDTNDGFGADSFAISAVPLPAGAWLILSGLGALAVARRRKSA